MRIGLLLVLAALAQAAPEALPQSLPSDDRFFTLMASALTTQGQTTTNLDGKRISAEGAYLLATKAAETKGLSSTVRCFVLNCAADVSYRYFSSVPRTRADLEGAVAPEDISEALSLIEDSLKMLERTPVPKAVLNVSPPVYQGGPIASGMDPKSIPDPEARAEYERRIAENDQATEELNARRRLQRSVRSLEVAISGIVNTHGFEAQAQPLKALITSSQLPAGIKAEMLGQQTTQPAAP